jgi:hypothetical protein
MKEERLGVPSSRPGQLAYELIGRGVSICMAIASAAIYWWLPLVIAPVVWQVWNLAFLISDQPDQPSIERHVGNALIQHRLANWSTWIISMAYLGYAVVGFGLYMDHWHGWVLGTFVGLLVAQVFKLLTPYRYANELRAMQKRREARGLR